ncbi:MAG TPA: STAS domain-containing protein [Myxococcaceae bacterium]
MKLSGSFDFPTAKALLRTVVSTPAPAAIQVDFSQVSEFSELALAGLGAWLLRRGRKVAAVGLGDRQRELLEELGFSAAFVRAA